MASVGLSGMTMEHVPNSWSGAWFFVLKKTIASPFRPLFCQWTTNVHTLRLGFYLQVDKTNDSRYLSTMIRYDLISNI